MTMVCSECNKEMVKAGKHRTRAGLFQRYKCQQCGRIKVGEKLA